MEASKAQFKCIMQAISAIRLDDGPARPPLALEDAQPDLSMDSDDSSDTGFWKEANGIKPKLKPKPVSRSVHVHPSSEDSDDEMYCSEMVKKNMKKREDAADSDDEKALSDLPDCNPDVNVTPMPKGKKSPDKVICVSINLDSCNLKTKMYLNLVHECVYSMHSNFTHMWNFTYIGVPISFVQSRKLWHGRPLQRRAVSFQATAVLRRQASFSPRERGSPMSGLVQSR